MELGDSLDGGRVKKKESWIIAQMVVITKSQNAKVSLRKTDIQQTAVSLRTGTMPYLLVLYSFLVQSIECLEIWQFDHVGSKYLKDIQAHIGYLTLKFKQRILAEEEYLRIIYNGKWTRTWSQTTRQPRIGSQRIEI